jgi:hypothetical protein
MIENKDFINTNENYTEDSNEKVSNQKDTNEKY